MDVVADHKQNAGFQAYSFFHGIVQAVDPAQSQESGCYHFDVIIILSILELSTSSDGVGECGRCWPCMIP